MRGESQESDQVIDATERRREEIVDRHGRVIIEEICWMLRRTKSEVELAMGKIGDK